MIRFRLIDETESREAFRWHSGFASANDALFPRPYKEFAKLAENRQLWCAQNSITDDFLALAYAHFDADNRIWEVGGLMVAVQHRRKGLGSIIMRLTLGHLLFEEDPIDSGCEVIAHVLESNKEPRATIENCLKFQRSKKVIIPGSALPGLRTNEDGNVVGDEFRMARPETLIALASWCDQWHDRLKDGTRATIKLRDGVSLDSWAQAMRGRA